MQGDKRDLYLVIDLGDIGAQALEIRKDGDKIFALLNIFFLIQVLSKSLTLLWYYLLPGFFSEVSNYLPG